MSSNRDYITRDVREAAILTNSYVAGTTISQVHEYNQLNLLISFTIGSLTTAEVKVEYSNDGVTFFQETFQAISGATATETLGEHQYGATGNYTLQLSPKYNFIKVSAKGTGTVTASSMSIEAILGDV